MTAKFKISLTTIIFCLGFAWASPPANANEEFPVAYFGIAGPSSGPGAMGHAFLVFTKKPKVILSGKAYQYNLEIPSGMMKDGLGAAAKAMMSDRLKMVLTTEDAFVFAQKYSNENRLVTLHRMNVSAREAGLLKEKLDQDLKVRSQVAIADYGILKNNCATKMIDLINSVVSSDRQIATNFKRGKVSIRYLVSIDSWTANVPIGLELVFEDHPLFLHDESYTLQPVMVSRIKLNLNISKLIDHLKSKCSWDESQTTIIKNFLYNNETKFTRSFQTYLQKQLAGCVDGLEGVSSLVDLLEFDLVYYSGLKDQQLAQAKDRLERMYSN